jgi:hypothetical protein
MTFLICVLSSYEVYQGFIQATVVMFVLIPRDITATIRFSLNVLSRVYNLRHDYTVVD